MGMRRLSPIINGTAGPAHAHSNDRHNRSFASCIGNGYREGKETSLWYLLSNDVGVVRGFGLEGAVVGPQIDRRGDASNASLIDLVETVSKWHICMRLGMSAAGCEGIQEQGWAHV